MNSFDDAIRDFNPFRKSSSVMQTYRKRGARLLSQCWGHQVYEGGQKSS